MNNLLQSDEQKDIKDIRVDKFEQTEHFTKLIKNIEKNYFFFYIRNIKKIKSKNKKFLIFYFFSCLNRMFKLYYFTLFLTKTNFIFALKTVYKIFTMYFLNRMYEKIDGNSYKKFKKKNRFKLNWIFLRNKLYYYTSYNKIIDFFYFINIKKINLYVQNISFTVMNNEQRVVEFMSKIKPDTDYTEKNALVLQQVLNFEDIFITRLSQMSEKIFFFMSYLKKHNLSAHLKYKIRNLNFLNKFLRKNIYLFHFFSVQELLNATKLKLKSLTLKYG
jgi:hypothetical protein